MSYTGVPVHVPASGSSNGTWNGNGNGPGPPNQSQYARAQSGPNGNYYPQPTYPSSNNEYARPPQNIQRSQPSPVYSDVHRSASHQHQQPSMQQPPSTQAMSAQFIDPSQLFQQPQHSYQNEKHAFHTGQRQNFQSAPAQTTAQRSDKIEQTTLLMSLAEEYFDAAHALTPSVAASLTTASLEEYQKLVATGLGLLETLLKKIRITPRMEANIRLRYAGVLYEETENYMEAETALSKGIVLCERNHYYDIKYAMQYLLAQIMFKKSPKASMKALDLNIADAETYKHISWVYALRFLRASHSLASGSLADSHAAIENLQNIAGLAQHQGDYSILIAACLMEALAYLKSSGPESLEGANRAIGTIRQFQTQPQVEIPQLIGITHVVDVICSVREGVPSVIQAKLKVMQEMIDSTLRERSTTWSHTDDRIAIPINRTPNGSQVVSGDTRMILGIGDDGRDNLMLSFMNLRDTYAITFLLCGIVLINKNATDRKAMKFLSQGLKQLESTNSTKSSILPECLSRVQWRRQLSCYICSQLAFCAAATGDWATVKKHLDKSKAFLRRLDSTRQGLFETLTSYLTGIYHQGTGDLDTALQIFGDERFALTNVSDTISTTAQVERDFAILAYLNSVWILQEPSRRDPERTDTMMEQLEAACRNHLNKDVQTAYRLVAATTTTSTTETKSHLAVSMRFSQQRFNVQFISITLVIMSSRFFTNVVGEQAEKSAMAASTQATKSGNKLWMAVADGLLAQCYQINGKLAQAEPVLQMALQHAEDSMPYQAP